MLDKIIIMSNFNKNLIILAMKFREETHHEIKKES